jgi:hypothetical protein
MPLFLLGFFPTEKNRKEPKKKWERKGEGRGGLAGFKTGGKRGRGREKRGKGKGKGKSPFRIVRFDPMAVPNLGDQGWWRARKRRKRKERN